MRRSGLVITGGILLTLLAAGALTANALTVTDEAGVPLTVDPVVATPDPAIPTPTPTVTPAPTTSPDPAPIPPAPPQDVDEDDDDLEDDDNDDG
jgi:hypothetical protein